jgi:EpsD family peptidyl-prolyl cis-trans isomerase
MTDRCIHHPASVAGVFLLACLLGACAPKSSEGEALPAAATVDKAVVSQMAIALAVPAEDKARRAAQLEAAIGEQLLANAAVAARLDADPVTVASVEAARRQLLARAYVRQKSATIARPTAAEVETYYKAHPELFAERRVYRIQEIAIKAPPERVKELDAALRSTANFAERAAMLKKMDVPFTSGVGVKAAEDLPADLLRIVFVLKDGDAFTVPNADGAAFLQLTGVESHPLTREQAQPAIERFMMNQRLGQLINTETKRLRGLAKISYSAPYQAPAP